MSVRMKTFIHEGRVIKKLRTSAGWKARHEAPSLWAKYDDSRRKASSTRHPEKSKRRGYAGKGRIPRNKWRKV